MLRAIALARSAPGLRQLDLGVNANNSAAIGRLQPLGFQASGRQTDAMRLNGALHDAVHMSLRLGPD